MTYSAHTLVLLMWERFNEKVLQIDFTTLTNITTLRPTFTQINSFIQEVLHADDAEIQNLVKQAEWSMSFDKLISAHTLST